MDIIEAPFEVSSQTSAQGAIVSISGDLDLVTITPLGERIKEAAGQSAGGFTLDLQGVEYIDSAGLALLVKTHKRLETGGRSVTIVVRPGSQPDRVLTLGRFGSLLNLSHESAAGVA